MKPLFRLFPRQSCVAVLLIAFISSVALSAVATPSASPIKGRPAMIKTAVLSDTTIRHVDRLVTANRIEEAVDYVTEQNISGHSQNSVTRAFSISFSLGIIYTARGDYGFALQQFEDAFRVMRSTPTLRACLNEKFFVHPCICYRMEMDFARLLSFVNEGLTFHGSPQGRGELITNKCFALYALGRYDEFNNEYRKFERLTPDEIGTMTNVAKSLKAFKLVEEDRSNEAQQMIKSIKNDGPLWCLSFVVLCQKYGQEALVNYYLRLLLGQTSRLKKSDIEKEIAALAARIGQRHALLEKQKADTRNAQLALEHSQLQLRNSNLELNQEEERNRLALMTKEHNALVLRKQQLLASSMRDSVATLSFLEKNYQRESQLKRNTFIAMALCLVILIVSTLVFFRHRYRLKKRLADAHDQLQETNALLEHANHEAQVADAQKSQFVRDMSHEVRTPLNAIVGFSGILSDMDDALPKEEKEDLLNRIVDNSEELSKLINDVLDLTSIESGRYEMKQEEVHPNALCRAAIDQLRHLFEPGVALDFHTDLSDTFTLLGDNGRISQVLLNLLGNAAKFTHHGSVSLSCGRKDGMVRFTVTDTGTGIAEAQMDEVFERFRKLDPFSQGNGLGLYICRVIIEKQGGQIGVDHEYRQGARFWFTLPEA